MLIDSPKFSREQQTERGTLPIAGFVRLRDSLFSAPDAGEVVAYHVAGGVDALARPVLRLTVSCRLLLRCQRCLKALPHDLAIDTTLRLVGESSLDAEMSDDPDEPDCIAASTALDLAALIEDEVLLALPAYPRHEESRCNGSGGADEVAGANNVSDFSALSKLSEFGKLGALKQKASKSKE
ncbi:MAG: YceD family protein [Burkholderiales bacterium]